MKVAAVQMCSGTERDHNLRTAERLIAQAAAEGAELVLLPEYFVLMGKRDTDKWLIKESLGHGPMQECMSALAKQHGIYLVAGSMPIAVAASDKVSNTCLVYDPEGMRIARYDKIHLFSFDNGKERYDESTTQVAGTQAVRFACPFGEVGLSICYDLRFPEHYRQFAGVPLILAPSAFTATTGKAHWELLLRARALENQCYVLAAAQAGLHENGRRTWGHSMLVDPWGEVVQLASEEGEAILLADIHLELIHKTRQNLPSLMHKRI
ncbi:MAG: hypothetical protein RLZZ502_855 [Pseudomonadota bacterium]